MTRRLDGPARAGYGSRPHARIPAGQTAVFAGVVDAEGLSVDGEEVVRRLALPPVREQCGYDSSS